MRQGKMSATEDKLCFLVCWDDKTAGLVRNFHLNFYPSDNSIDMLDLKSKKLFLKKTVHEQVQPNDLYVGNSLVVFGRKLTIVDSVTKPATGRTAESTLALVKPGSQHQLGDILSEIQQAGLKLARARLVLFSGLQAGQFYDELRGQPYYQALGECNVAFLSGPMSLYPYLRSGLPKLRAESGAGTGRPGRGARLAGAARSAGQRGRQAGLPQQPACPARPRRHQ